MRKPRVELLVLPFLLPHSSAISLASFQVVVSNSLSSACLQAYNAEIPDCQRTDFNTGPCSIACTASLQKTGDSVKQACGALGVSSLTLLGAVLEGKILSALCPSIASSTSIPPSTRTTPTDIKIVPSTSLTSASRSASSSPSSASSSLSSASSLTSSTSTKKTSVQSLSSISLNTNFSYITSLPTPPISPPTSSAPATARPNSKTNPDGSPFGASAEGGGGRRRHNSRGLAVLALIGTAAVMFWL